MLMMCHSTAAGAKERVLSLLRITRVDQILSLFGSAEEAAEGF